MGIFNNIKNTAAARARGAFFVRGIYLCRVVTCRHVASKVGTDEFFVVDFDVIESNNPELEPGCSATWMAKLTGKFPALALADVKAFIMAATGAAEQDVGETEVMDAIDGDGSALSGQVVRVQVEDVVTKSGASFSKHSFRVSN
jgi:hypothetical protein